MKVFLTWSIMLFSGSALAQNFMNYVDSMRAFRDNYVQTHEVVKKEDKSFLQFFPISTKFRVVARFEKTTDGRWFTMKTSGKESQVYRKYGKLIFTLEGKPMVLFLYQSQSLMNDKTYRNYLFIPFTDSTSGEESYGGGRYLECFSGDIRENQLDLDFNKAYNPYCAYAAGYNCPIPPRENDLPVSVRAGEKNYAKKVH